MNRPVYAYTKTDLGSSTTVPIIATGTVQAGFYTVVVRTGDTGVWLGGEFSSPSEVTSGSSHDAFEMIPDKEYQFKMFWDDGGGFSLSAATTGTSASITILLIPDLS